MKRRTFVASLNDRRVASTDAPDQVGWLTNGRIFPVADPEIGGCIEHLTFGEQVVPLTDDEWQERIVDDKTAWCPYHLAIEPTNFVRSPNAVEIWFVEDDGTRQHMTLACHDIDPAAYPDAPGSPWRVFLVSSAQSLGHEMKGVVDMGDRDGALEFCNAVP